jgi:anti-anti-sigma factor
LSALHSPFHSAPDGDIVRAGLLQIQLLAGRRRSVSLRLVGELDLASRDELRASLLAAEESAAVVSIDLTDLDFIDCAGLTVLHDAAARAVRSGRKLVLIGGSGQVQRVLDLTGWPASAERRRRAPSLELVETAADG